MKRGNAQIFDLEEIAVEKNDFFTGKCPGCKRDSTFKRNHNASAAKKVAIYTCSNEDCNFSATHQYFREQNFIYEK